MEALLVSFPLFVNNPMYFGDSARGVLKILSEGYKLQSPAICVLVE